MNTEPDYTDLSLYDESLYSDPHVAPSEKKVAQITREGSGRHRAGRIYYLSIDGRSFGAYETLRSAREAAQAAGAVVEN